MELKLFQYKSKNKFKNLCDISEIFNSVPIKYFLFDRTMLYAVKVNLLSPEDTDNIVIWKEDFIENKSSLSKLFIKYNYSVVFVDMYGILLSRGGKFLQVDFILSNNGNKVLIDLYKFKAKYFLEAKNVLINEKRFNVSRYSDNLIEEISYIKANKLFSSLVRIFLSPRILNLKKYFIYLSLCKNIIVNNLNKFITPKHRKISHQEFLSLVFDPDELNHILRENHISYITGGFKYKTVGEIVAYLKSADVKELCLQSKESDLSKPISEPLYWSKEFWSSGNNYFINSIYYEFRKDVVPYIYANKYIIAKRKPELYTREYFESLEIMSDTEIKLFLEKHSIEVCNNSITSGRHRVCAMIGRLVKDKPYLPFYNKS